VHNRLWGELVSEEVTSPQFSVLLALQTHPDADQRTIGLATSLDRSTVADVVTRMMHRGYLERRRDPLDQRRNRLRLTAAGQAQLEELMTRSRAMNQRLLEMLEEPERSEFLRLLTTFVARIEESGPPGTEPLVPLPGALTGAESPTDAVDRRAARR
jgi:DNA-binding MarR family transcriptional regulator